MIVLDTHTWIWLVGEPDQLSGAARDAIDGAETLGVSAISTWEIATKERRGRLRLDRPVHVWRRQALAVADVEELPVTGPIALRAGAFADGIPGDPADRLIAATALDHGAALVTKDGRLQGTAATIGLRWIW